MILVFKNLYITCFSVNVIVRRVGGGYGGKITRSCQIACAAALVSHLSGKTCRFILSMEPNMKIIGKRLPTSCNFEVIPRSLNIFDIKNIHYLIYNDF